AWRGWAGWRRRQESRWARSAHQLARPRRRPGDRAQAPRRPSAAGISCSWLGPLPSPPDSTIYGEARQPLPRLIQISPVFIKFAPDWPGMPLPRQHSPTRKIRSEPMRVVLLAATMLCFTAIAAQAQPRKMNPAGSDPNPLTGALRDVVWPWLDDAMQDVGTNPTGWKRQWCARSVNLWLQKSGRRGCAGNTAISCLSAGRKLSDPQVGALAVMQHHVGIVKEVHENSVTLVSGNHSGMAGNRRVGVGKNARCRVVAYVWPE